LNIKLTFKNLYPRMQVYEQTFFIVTSEQTFSIVTWVVSWLLRLFTRVCKFSRLLMCLHSFMHVSFIHYVISYFIYSYHLFISLFIYSYHFWDSLPAYANWVDEHTSCSKFKMGVGLACIHIYMYRYVIFFQNKILHICMNGRVGRAYVHIDIYLFLKMKIYMST